MFSFRRRMGNRMHHHQVPVPPVVTKDELLRQKDELISSSSSAKDNNNNNMHHLQAFFRRLHTHNNNSSGANIPKSRRRQRHLGKKKAMARAASFKDRSGMIRKSTSTYLTEQTNRSSVFLADPLAEVGPVAMSDFLLAEELAAYTGGQQRQGQQEEETKREITADETDEDNDHATATPVLGNQPLHYIPQHNRRIPPPESYYEMKQNEHAELGKIQFECDNLEDAKEESARREQPILCIEAEIPGDITTGETIFSHPLIVEAAESLFVTVCRRPLEPQEDDAATGAATGEEDDAALIRRRFDRRFFTNSSCRTRVRIMDDMGIDVLPPVEHMSAVEVVAALVRGLESYRMHVPRYLRLLLEEEAGKLQVLSKTRFREIQGHAVFGMYNPVLAEVEFAGLDGVLATRSGSLVRQQVVEVTYDSRRLSYCALVRHALRHGGATLIYYETNEERIAAQLEVQQFEESRAMKNKIYGTNNVKGDNDDDDEGDTLPAAIKVTEYFGNLRSCHNPKPALRASVLRFVPLTDLQATKANRLIHFEKFNEAMHLLSPRQGLIAMQALRAHHSKDFQDLVDIPIARAWSLLCVGEDASASAAHFTKVAASAASAHCFDDWSDCPTEDPTEEYEDPFLQ